MEVPPSDGREFAVWVREGVMACFLCAMWVVFGLVFGYTVGVLRHLMETGLCLKLTTPENPLVSAKTALHYSLFVLS